MKRLLWLLIHGNREGGRSSCKLGTTSAAEEINVDAEKATNLPSLDGFLLVKELKLFTIKEFSW